jgi:putative aldouronate transport system permease protein
MGAEPARGRAGAAEQRGAGGIIRAAALVGMEARRNWQLYGMLLLPVAFAVIFSYVPMAGVIMAFEDYSIRRGILGSELIGFQHFIDFFSSPMFSTVLVNSLALSLYSFLASFPIPIVLAIALNECRPRWLKQTVQMLTYAPFFISTVIIVGIVMQLLDFQTGLVNNIINTLGGKRVNFMGAPNSFPSIYVWSGVWQTSGYSAVVYLAALSAIDPCLVEAALMDGASRLQKIVHIDLPGIQPTLIILLLLSIAGFLNVGFEKVYLLQNNLNIGQSEVITTYVYKQGITSFSYAYATAIGLFNSFINLVLLVGANAVVRRTTDTSLW